MAICYPRWVVETLDETVDADCPQGLRSIQARFRRIVGFDPET